MLRDTQYAQFLDALRYWGPVPVYRYPSAALCVSRTVSGAAVYVSCW
jgi:hypothetical protein